ncbi:MAG: Ig-like domain-containing protein [Bacteroidia bacterium]|nr:Ig-like domain-containing protein [Bacteroidia bacterium]
MKIYRVILVVLLIGISVAFTSCEKEPKSIPVSGITLDSTSLTLTEGETARLTATISPSNADNQGVIWSSSNESVASVSNGTVTAVAAGSATITAKSDDGGKTATCNVTVNSKIVSVTGISLDKTSLELTEGDEYALVVSVQPSNASNQSISWTSSDKTVASVDNGKVTALKPGNAVITVTTSDGNKTAKCEVKVNEKIYHVESVSLDKSSLELTEGDEYTLVTTILPENATNKQVTWKSDDETIATVSNGLVKAIKPGIAKIIATSKDGNKTAECEVTVKERIYHVESVSLNKTSLDLTEGEECTLIATIAPSNATNKSITWSSSDSSIAAIDQNGKVKAIKVGMATITASSNDGGKIATCYVSIIAFQPEMVDLGLSVKWANCNIGARVPEEYGDYYAWGATEPLYEPGYAQENPLRHWKEGKALWGYYWSNTPFQTINTTSYSSTKWIKYIGSTSSPFKDANATNIDALKTVLDAEDDAAHVYLGNKWRIPTKEEIEELINTANCTWTWTSINGVPGYKVTSKKSGYTGKWIFFPAAGSRGSTLLQDIYYIGRYWSSSLNVNSPTDAIGLSLSADSIYLNRLSCRYNGLSIRPVCD